MAPRSPRLDEVDRELAAAEVDASPNRFGGHRRSDEIERVVSASSVSTSSSSGHASGARSRPLGMSRVSTQRDLERHPTEISRIHTARSQHSGTVGRSATSRQSRKPLPAFGAGKPYPPLLPDQEDYVVEFDGPDDPMHAQNWPLRKK
jgi:DHA1 family multidrug resistance protein-like MFS transporter